MTKLSTTDLQLKANDVRVDIINMLAEAKSGHSAGPLGMADVFTALYFGVMNHEPKNPKWDGRDYLVLSCGHICPVLYGALAEAGYFPKDELKTLRKLNTRLQGHPHNIGTPGIETTSGPLSQGSSQAAGIAYGLLMDKKPNRVFLIASDGEQQEGQTWEAAMFAGKYKLRNLIAIMDRNNIQIDGGTEEVMPLEKLREKYESFNWDVIEINGHNFNEIIAAYERAKNSAEKPTMIIAHTVPGKGVGYMENNYLWHGNPPGIADVAGAPPKAEQTAAALADLAKARDAIK
ncbi:MAG: transketolase [Patescibacteria group bacterium]|nr:transketolase [Patescibacteria group bacterium]